MPIIRPISDLHNSANEISDLCRQTREPVYITRNGTGDMVVLSIEEYERQQALLTLYGKLAIAEQEIAAMPEHYPHPRDLALAAKGYRYRTVKDYLVLYMVVGDTVQVHRILYGRRDYNPFSDKEQREGNSPSLCFSASFLI